MPQAQSSEKNAMEVYQCTVCNLEIPEDDETEKCPQCGTMDQFYLVE